MRGGRCHRRKMMGRGAEGGCGAEERPCPVSRVASHASASTASRDVCVGHYVQARKALSERCPFEEEEALTRVVTLPVGFAAALSRSSDGRRKHRKVHAEHAKKDPSAQAPPAPWSVWTETEEYFRPITLADIDKLEHKLPLICGSSIDSCLTIPLLREEDQNIVITAAAEECRNSSLASVAANGAVDVVESLPCEGVVVKQQQHEEGLRQQPQNTEIGEQQLQEGQQKEDELGEQPMEIDQVTVDGALCCTSAENNEDLVDYSSVSWILHSRNRTILASERPTKKRKLLGTEAGLERLLILPQCQAKDSFLCDYCCSGVSNDVSNRLLHCASCKVSVHMKCYGVHDVPDDSWLCSWCKHPEVGGSQGANDVPGPCLLCPKKNGALKPVEADTSQSKASVKFAHLFCSLWMPEVYVDNIEAMEPLKNVEVQEARKRVVCNLCKVKHGACVRCSHGTCRTSFHPVCAREAKQRMEIWGKHKSGDVELRAFCSKHSTFEDVDYVQLPEDSNKQSTDQTSTSRVSGIPKIRIIRKEEKSEAGVTPGSNGASLSQDILFDGESCNSAGNSASDVNVLLVSLKKLFDCGKINVTDIALKMQVPSDSLAMALAGNTDSLSSEVKSKIVKWLQDAYVDYSVRHLNSISGCVLSSSSKGNNNDEINTQITGVNALDAVLVKSLPPRRRTKSNIRILKDNRVVYTSGEAFPDEYPNGKLLGEFVEDKLGEAEVICSRSFSCDQDSCDKEQNIPMKIQENSPGRSEVSSFVQHQHGNGRLTCSENHDELVHHQQHSNVERVPSFSASDLKTAGPYSSAHVHPFIQKRMIKLQSNSEADSDDQEEHCQTLLETDSSLRKCYYPVSSNLSSANQRCMLDDEKLEQFPKPRSSRIMEVNPEDELEGEILYFQNKLLNTAVTMKQRCENLMMKVVRHLPEELDSLKKKRWDLVVVNQFLRHVREAKKRGRKEKRHKEYQAVLAAAAAAVETSTRMSSLRKETTDAHSEVTAGSERSGANTRAPKAKETHSKLAASSIPSEKLTEANAALCDVCGRSETILNRIFFCGGCKVPVHLDCYRRPRSPISFWFCDVCEELQSSSHSHGHPNAYEWGTFQSDAQCCICGAGTGALRKTTTGQWVHNFCAEWLLESTFRRGQEHPVEGMEAILKESDMPGCSVCHQNTGICIKCSYGNCQVAFHPFCARRVGLFMIARTINGKLQHKAYCEKHGTEQRQKADVQQYGAEELTSIKQIRVELEKVRLLCERIIRREKLKRELVLCSHDILASRRDYIAFSVLVNSSLFPPGVSSESATTSINNRSYSDTVQRSDDVTVDSSVSVKRKVRLPFQIEIDRKTEDSSTSQLVPPRKGTDRISFSGKKIPHRQTSATPRHTVDEEKKLKPRKHMEIFQKEVMMTSDQASIQNRRLPKGFVYVPVDSLPKTHNIETREPRKPDG